MKRWKILSETPEHSQDIEFTCTKCGGDALLPVAGRVIAQIEMGLIGDGRPIFMPDEIQCPHCQNIYERDESLAQ